MVQVNIFLNLQVFNLLATIIQPSQVCEGNND